MRKLFICAIIIISFFIFSCNNALNNPPDNTTPENPDQETTEEDPETTEEEDPETEIDFPEPSMTIKTVDNEITVVWSLDDDVTEYEVFYGTSLDGSDAVKFSGEISINASEGAVTVTDINAGTVYHIWICGKNGNEETDNEIFIPPEHINNNANLQDITTSHGSLSPLFDKTVKVYTVSVPNTVASITVNAIPENSDATINYSATQPMNIITGQNSLTITVTAKDEVTSNVYMITITRQDIQPGDVIWAKSTQSATGNVVFQSVVEDSDGNYYVAGHQMAGTVSYGNEISLTAATDYSGILLKYNSSGVVQWAKIVNGADHAPFVSLDIDSSGNLFVAGWLQKNSTANFGNGVSVTAINTLNYGTYNMLLVKYNSSGIPQWARTVQSGRTETRLYAVAADTAGNAIVAGWMGRVDETPNNLGNDITINTPAGSAFSILIAKYNGSGTVQWAKTIESSTNPGTSGYYGLATDNYNNVYAVGYQFGTNVFPYGNSVTATGTANRNNALLVKYNASGVTQWARTVTGTATYQSGFNTVDLDSIGNIYAGGYQGLNYKDGTSFTYTYGAGVVVEAPNNETNMIVIKYNSSGTAQWGRTILSGDDSQIDKVVAHTEGVYAIGNFNMGNYNFGNGKTANIDNTSGIYFNYNSSGTIQTLKTVETTSIITAFNSLAVNVTTIPYTVTIVGSLQGIEECVIGSAVGITGTYSDSNPFIFKLIQ